jgi:hypothetical protein
VGGWFYWVSRAYQPPSFVLREEVTMLSRLVILACAREVAEGMERAGVDPWVVSNWTSRLTTAVCVPVDTVEQARILEDHVRTIFRAGMVELEKANNAAE